MADLKHLKVQPHGEGSDVDPLTELTRIMGLSPHSAHPDGDIEEFGIDLEREMLGEAGANDSHAPVRPAAAASTPPARAVLAQSMEGWKTAFAEVASPSRGHLNGERSPASNGPALGSGPKTIEQQPRAELPPRPAARVTEIPALRRGGTDFRTPEAVAPAPRIISPAPAEKVPPMPDSDKSDEDPFERLAAFSREWLDRRQPGAAPAEGGGTAQPAFRMPDQPAGPVSKVPAAERPATTPAPPPRPSSYSSPAPRVAERPVAAAPAPVSSPRPPRMIEPAPVVAPAPVAPPAPVDKVFDPFAELVAMAGPSRQATAAPTAPAAPAPVASAPAAPASGPSAAGAPLRPSQEPAAFAAAPQAGPQSQSNIANPSIITRRTNWQSVTGRIPAEPPVADARPVSVAPIAAVPIAAASGAAHAAEPDAETAAPPVDVAGHANSPEPVVSFVAHDEPADMRDAAAIAPEPVVEPDMAGDPTWDAISDWVRRPSERNYQPSRVDAPAQQEPDDDSYYSMDDGELSVLPPVARIPGLDPFPDDQNDFNDFGDDFDLESLLRSELEGDGFRVAAARFDADVDEPIAASFLVRAVPPAEPEADDEPAGVQASELPEAREDTPFLEIDTPVVAADEPGDDGMPDVDTVEVPTALYVVADDIDVPELAVEDDVQPAVASDDIDADFGGGFEDRAETRPAAALAGAAGSTENGDWIAARPRGPEAGEDEAVSELDAAFDAAVRSWAESETETASAGDVVDDEAVRADFRSEPLDLDDVDGFDPEYHPSPVPAYQGRSANQSRGFVVAAVVAGVAVLGGIGAFMMSIGGGGGGDTPALVRADPEPVKVKPEQPGGATVPNQDKAVYERFSNSDAAMQPEQERLLSAEEEPVNLAVRTVPITAPTPLIDPAEAETSDQLPGAFGEPADTTTLKSEDRLEQSDDIDAAPTDDLPVIAPRRVRTMVVRPDGTLVPREEPEGELVAAVEPASDPASAGDGGTAEAPAQPDVAPAPLAQAPIRTNEAEAGAEPKPADPAPVPAVREELPVRTVETRTITRDQATPVRGPVAPTRPSDQPVEIIGNAGAAARGTQVAAAAPAPVVAAKTSEWSMQIASQPSPEGAQSSYADLSRRYASVLSGRGVNIVKAEIAGKGTYWRVRIPTASRADATALCERYKAAGGSCFVSK